MRDKQEHINPWDDKLQHAAFPPTDESWGAMKAILDQELPSGVRRDRRRWLLLVFMLLLLTGVCHCPGARDRSSMMGHVPGELPVAGAMPPTPAAGKVPAAVGVPVMPADPGDAGPRVPVSPAVNRGKADRPHAVKHLSNRDGWPTTGRDSAARRDPAAGRDAHGRRDPAGGDEGDSVAGSETGVAKQGSAKRRTATKGSATVQGYMPVKIPAAPADSGKRRSGRTDTTVAVQKKGIASLPPARDTNAKPIVAKHPEPKPMVAKQPERRQGWAAGIGLNQSLAIGDQQGSNYNSGGTRGDPADYIPVPLIRYYFNPKLYVQIEAQFNAPQYTRRNLLFGRSPADSSGGGLQSSEYLRKLWYFQVPVSLHYSPLPHFYAGAGLQFSRLTNGIVLYDSRLIVPGSPDSVLSSAVSNIKRDSVYAALKGKEFRLLLDINYEYKKFVVGLRYSQAFGNFIDVQASRTQVTTSKNSSLQLYLRYIFWDHRKTKR